MNISARCEYACRAIIELTLHQHEVRPLTALQIAELRKVPEKYLVHILLQLKRAGLVKSVRGAQGGYLLGKGPDEITLHDIVRAIDGPILDPLPVEESVDEDLEPTWRDVASRITNVLSEITVRDILDRAANTEMYHI